MEIFPRITVDPDICHGRPTVNGTRMRVVDILEMLAGGATEEEILEDFEFISAEDIRACLTYISNANSWRALLNA